jgi:hypothetical protein
MADEQTKQEYMGAYEDWRRQLEDVHRLLFEGQRLDPPKLKGLLNREARAKLRYDAARRKLLGITDESMGPGNEGEA